MPTAPRSGFDIETLFLLWAARETGVLDALTSRAGTADAVAAETEVTPEAARVVVESLADLGFLRRVGDEYEVTNRALGFLAKRDVRSIGRLPHALDVLDRYTALPETMTTGTPPEPSDDSLVNRLGAHAATDEAVVRASVTAAIRLAPRAERVLNVAGGSGVYAREFAARGFETTMCDGDDVVEYVAPALEREDVTLERRSLATVADGTYDLVFGENLCRSLDVAEVRTLFSTVEDALSACGAAVFVEPVRGRSSSTATVRASMEALATGSGGAHTDAQYREWFAEAGFEAVRVDDVPGTDLRAVGGYKRGVD
ncbi:methyltransferase domain-containing protein [Haloprofundus sp. MHR1]|uniref:methyltransferase domain-containing protein n=1 Tax=Haloprofundus sp. MHR1 TaxID=2572921 RepID=UPI0010BEA9D4|nr:methyltransferase domain-containing protein [Haloprofundus sp. MHR1]QCJ47282.1 methyltransferase domain-containing protein [Haloprofundus sp. MHR1]